MVGLNELWYKDYPRSGFHFFNDNHQWLQVDKIGHAMTAYYISKLSMDAIKWSGVSSGKAMWYGSVFGLVFLSSFEVFDGLSAQWGASIGDMAANTIGVACLIAQQKTWQEQRLLLKFSFYPSKYPQYRPTILGSNFNEQILKDYNGHTYWLSINAASFFKNKGIPDWLNLALGYGADGMLGGNENPFHDKNGNVLPYFNRQRQFYFSLDIDLTRIKTKSRLLNSFFNAFGFVKIPFPALEFRGQKILFHPLYF